MADAMPERNSSRTALGVAALRAVHQLLDGEPKILHDPVAVRLLDADVLQQIRSNPARSDEPLIKGLRSHVVLCEAAMRKSAWPRRYNGACVSV